jgi:hypothetical protein
MQLSPRHFLHGKEPVDAMGEIKTAPSGLCTRVGWRRHWLRVGRFGEVVASGLEEENVTLARPPPSTEMTCTVAAACSGMWAAGLKGSGPCDVDALAATWRRRRLEMAGAEAAPAGSGD